MTTNDINTSSWKTYRNEEYGFEVRYPIDEVVNIYQNTDCQKEVFIPASSKSNEIYITNRSATFVCNAESYTIGILIKNENIDAKSWLNANQARYSEKEEIESIKDIVIGGRNAIELIGNSNIGSVYKLIVIQMPNYLIVIQQNAENELLDKILSTFKFINSKQVGCPEGELFVKRVIGGWKEADPFDLEGKCISNEIINQSG